VLDMKARHHSIASTAATRAGVALGAFFLVSAIALSSVESSCQPMTAAVACLCEDSGTYEPNCCYGPYPGDATTDDQAPIDAQDAASDASRDVLADGGSDAADGETSDSADASDAVADGAREAARDGTPEAAGED
jgi:hypothetical protein